MTNRSPLPAGLDLDRLRFDPSEGTVIREPLGTGYGFWAGGAKVSFDQATGTFVLFYRQRSPLEKGRGAHCAIALSDDGVTFRDVWTATKEEFAAGSIEVGHCLRDPSGEWRLYVSYEVAGVPYWRIDVVRAPTIEALDAQSRRTVLWPIDYALRSLKDPIVYLRDGRYYVYMAGPHRRPPVPGSDTLSVIPMEATLLGISEDGLYFPELRYVFEAPNVDAWWGKRARINSLVPIEGGTPGPLRQRPNVLRHVRGVVRARLERGRPQLREGAPRRAVGSLPSRLRPLCVRAESGKRGLLLLRVHPPGPLARPAGVPR